ncbi:MAG TPA: hypothetical protein PJ995_21650 [Cyclobacteriaceae bacterium]|nr:hypothetical protein [Cyclobacteriaceae bacterium]HMY95673.1 hypothetical protein [Cyclobacteriaceae bacterium]HNA14600.1 hypothetical protein [Cyclobacteriaceae bacterium]
MFDFLTENGFSYTGMCAVCHNNFKVYTKGNTEIKAHVSGNYFKFYEPDKKGNMRQTAYGNFDKLKTLLA